MASSCKANLSTESWNLINEDFSFPLVKQILSSHRGQKRFDKLLIETLLFFLFYNLSAWQSDFMLFRVVKNWIIFSSSGVKSSLNPIYQFRNTQDKNRELLIRRTCENPGEIKLFKDFKFDTQ